MNSHLSVTSDAFVRQVTPPCLPSCSSDGWSKLRRSRSWPVPAGTRLTFSPYVWLELEAQDQQAAAPSTNNTSMLATVWSHMQHVWDTVLYDIVVVFVLAHRPKHRLKTSHIHAICHLILGGVCTAFALIQLQSVLLPVLMAAGIAALLEPLMFLLIDPWVRIFRERPRIQGVYEDESLEHIGIEMGGPSPPVSPTHGDMGSSCHHVCGDERAVSAILRRLWCVVAVSFTIGALLAMISAVGVWTVASIKEVNWSKYINGHRMSWVRSQLESYGISDFETAFRKVAAFVIQSLGMKIIGSTMSALTGFLLMILFLGFFLVDSAADRSVGKEPWRSVQRKIIQQVAHRVPVSDKIDKESVLWIKDDIIPLAATTLGRLRLQMRVYIRQKCHLSLLKACIIGLVLALLQVDLWVIWTLLTFVLNFVPLGSAISTLAPIPFVFLDPEKEFWMIATCVLWPILVHNVVGNIVEPKVFANSLSLHPVTVLLALTFWTALWGMMGALVCVPLTAMIRVTLNEADAHPYAATMLHLMEGVIAAPRSSPEILDLDRNVSGLSMSSNASYSPKANMSCSASELSTSSRGSSSPRASSPRAKQSRKAESRM